MDKSSLAFVTYHDKGYGENLGCNLFFTENVLQCKDHYIFSRRDLEKHQIYKKNKKIFDYDEGAGLWAWKPWAIIEALKLIEDEQILFYHDCGKGLKYKNFIYPKEIIGNLKAHKFIVGVETDIYGKNLAWSHRHCIESIGQYNDYYLNHNVIEAVISFWTKSDESFAFLEEWMNSCLKEELICDDKFYSPDKQNKNFIKHQRDQSILTNLAIKYNVPRIFPIHLKSPLIKSISILEIDQRAKNSNFFKALILMINFLYLIKLRLRNLIHS